MSKPPAKSAKTTPASKATSTKAAPSKAAPARPAKPKSAPAPAAKAPAKPAAKAAARPAVKTPAKSAPPARPPSKAKSAPKPGTTKAPAKSPASASASVAAASPKGIASRPPVKPAAAPPQPTAAPVANRFTDRFGPATKPLPHVMAEAADVPKPAQKVDPKLANAWKTKAGRDLTEAELLAMPEAEFMNEKQLDFFRARLQQQKDELLSSAGETTEHLREDTSIVPDPVDRATIEEEHALELRTRDRERKLLKKIAQSLHRIDTGEYGFCDETGEPIGLPRLIARPTATLSLEAQQRRELKQKMFGD